jgi:hypothetical protein
LDRSVPPRGPSSPEEGLRSLRRQKIEPWLDLHENEKRTAQAISIVAQLRWPPRWASYEFFRFVDVSFGVCGLAGVLSEGLSEGGGTGDSF